MEFFVVRPTPNVFTVTEQRLFNIFLRVELNEFMFNISGENLVSKSTSEMEALEAGKAQNNIAAIPYFKKDKVSTYNDLINTFSQ